MRLPCHDRSASAPVITSHVEADGHYEIHEVAGAGRFDQTGAQWADQLEDQLVGLDALEAIAQELGVEADLEWLAAKRHGHGLAGLADVGGLRRDGQRALTEAEAQRRVLQREQADAP